MNFGKTWRIIKYFRMGDSEEWFYLPHPKSVIRNRSASAVPVTCSNQIPPTYLKEPGSRYLYMTKSKYRRRFCFLCYTSCSI